MSVNCANPFIYAKTGASAPPPDVNQQWLDMQQVEATSRFLLNMPK